MFYTFVRALLMVLLKPLFRYDVSGKENIPKSGPVILAINHTSYLDPVLIAVSLTRPINFMGKAELFKIPVLGPVITGLNAFPVKRGVPDKAAIAHSIKLLNNGEVLLIFPEGTRIRNNNGRLGKAYPGATMLALKAGTPIVPIGITGAEKVLPDGSKFPRFQKLRVRIGAPITVEKVAAAERKEKEAELTAKVMDEIGVLIAGGTN